MNALLPADHLLVAYLAIVFPLLARRSFPAVAARIRAGGEGERLRAYRHTVITWLLHLSIVLVLWVAAGRSWEALGLRASAWPELLVGGLLGTLLLAGLHIVHTRRVRRREDRASVERALGDLAELLPRSAAEQRMFRIVSINAGLSEELLYRGYLLWYLTQFSVIEVAAPVAMLVFTLAHLYQGLRMLPGIALMSAFFVMLYLVSGSLLLPIIFHAAVDMLQGYHLAPLLRRSGR